MSPLANYLIVRVSWHLGLFLDTYTNVTTGKLTLNGDGESTPYSEDLPSELPYSAIEARNLLKLFEWIVSTKVLAYQ